MNSANLTQPDVTLLLDRDGVIREATLSNALAEEGIDAWIGRPWEETVADVGVSKVRRMVEDARTSRVSVFRQINQCFPSGQQLLMEYTTVSLGEQAGLIAIGKSLQAVAELQSRLIAAQQAMERDYWKLREIETRYRLLFDASNEAVLLIRASDLNIVESNPAAIRALGLSPVGRVFPQELPARERDAFQSMLLRVREHGRSPGILVHLGSAREPWRVRASLIPATQGPCFLLQLTPVGTVQLEMVPANRISVQDLITRGPDGFVVIDRQGGILRTNQAFLDLIQIGADADAIGKPLDRWLGRPGADLSVLLAIALKQGSVRLYATTLRGELGTDTDVEASATCNTRNDPQYIGLLIRDVGWRLAPPKPDKELAALLAGLAEQIGRTPLRKLLKDTTSVIERHSIEAALELTSDNRSAAAELLGLSRQTLYVKLNQYGFPVDTTSDRKH